MTNCNPSSFNLYNNVQNAIDCTIASQGPNVSSLGQAVILADLNAKEPYVSMNKLLSSKYVKCDHTIPVTKQIAAAKAFYEVSGYKPLDLNNIFNKIFESECGQLNANALYFFVSVFILLVILIWIMVSTKLINALTGLYLTLITFIVLYYFSVIYRISLRTSLQKRNEYIHSKIDEAQTNFESSIAYYPQTLYAIASAVMNGCDGWTCNEEEPNIVEGKKYESGSESGSDIEWDTWSEKESSSEDVWEGREGTESEEVFMKSTEEEEVIEVVSTLRQINNHKMFGAYDEDYTSE